MNFYYIGGSPCSGKSSVAEALCEKWGYRYVKMDDQLDRYTKLGADQGYPICSKLLAMTADETWMRDPRIQCEEELAFYREIFAFIMNDLAQLPDEQIVTEGAAFLPELMRGVATSRYISITPTKTFQVTHYAKRPWITHVLKDCQNPKQAFSNWTERDALFALAVQQQCQTEQLMSVVNDGTSSLAQLVGVVEAHFKMKKQ